MSNLKLANLTQREQDCIDCLKQGKTAREISITLGISKRTVESHTERIKDKLACNSLFQLGYNISKMD